MIVNHIGGHDFQKSKNRVSVLRTEQNEQAAIVIAEFQVSILDQIVQQRARRIAPLAGCSERGGGDNRMKSLDEFAPRLLIFRGSAQSY